MGLLVVDAAGEGEAVGDLFVVIDLLEVLGIGDECDEPIAALRALANIDEFDARGSGGELAEVG
jgi:hypothetical protein